LPLTPALSRKGERGFKTALRLAIAALTLPSLDGRGMRGG